MQKCNITWLAEVEYTLQEALYCDGGVGQLFWYGCYYT